MKSNLQNVDFGILNFWWCDDHGAILTAFALQRFLLKEGYSSELLKCFWNYDDSKREGGISELFEQKHLVSSGEVYSTYNDIFSASKNRELNDRYVGFITGSDQVFRPEYVPDSWFLTFVNGKGKMAVSASFGTDRFNVEDPDRLERIRNSIKSFDFISIREDSGLEICKKIFDVEANYLLDPVFLINKREYEDIIEESKLECKEKYIFCYIRDKNEHVEKLIHKMANKNGLSVVMCDERMLIEDFLFYISNSEYVITDSYHGMCFAIIYNKYFTCIRNIKRGRTRFETIEKRLGLSSECYVDENEDIVKMIKIDYRETNMRLQQLSELGADTLKKALKEIYFKYSSN